MSRQRARSLLLAGLVPLTLALAACGDDDSTSSTDASTPGTDAGVEDVVAGEPFPEARCAANRDAGTITYLSSFDFAASASIVDVLVADQKGYYEDLCLDVELKPSFSTANYPLIASNSAQFSSGGSFSEVVDYAEQNDAQFVVVAVEGHTPIDSLIVKPGKATELTDLEGTTIGVKGKLPPSIAAMLATADLQEGEDFQTLLLDGFDPTAHIAIEQIVGFPGYRSNEPGQLDRAGVDYDLFLPDDYGIPGSFGLLYTNAQFVQEHPTAAEDFVRATMKGLEDATGDPVAAADIAVGYINGNGNPNFLSPEGEVFRWQTESELVTGSTPDGQPLGAFDPATLQGEVDAYAKVGLFGGTAPDISPYVNADLISRVYGPDLVVIWPST